MNKLQVEMVKIHKAVSKKAHKMYDDAYAVSVAYGHNHNGQVYGVDYVHVHTHKHGMVSFRGKLESSIKRILQQMTEENSF